MVSEFNVVFGPEVISRISAAIHELMPLLAESRYRVLPDGNLEFTEEGPLRAVMIVRNIVEEALPRDLIDRIGRTSGLGWNVFFGHVIAWWLPQRDRMGFLRALVDRAALHKVKLQLHWNQDTLIQHHEEAPGVDALIWGGAAGFGAAFVAMKMWPFKPMLGFLTVAAGLVMGRIWQRVTRRKFCGDSLCQSPIPRRAKACPSCGAVII